LTDPPRALPALPRWVVPLVLAAGVLLRLAHYLDRESLWGDEAMLGLNIASRSFGRLMQPLDYGQLASIPFLWAERLMVALGGVNELALRALPLAASIALLVLMVYFPRRILDSLGAVIALGLAASSTFLIRYSSELKPYTVDAVMALLIGWYALDLAERPDERSRWVRFGVVGLLGVLVSTSALFVCCGAAVCVGWDLVAQRQRRQLAMLAACGAVWLAVVAAGYLIFYRHAAGGDYMRDFWRAGFLTTATPALPRRTMMAVQETFLPVSDWMVRFGLGLPPLILAVTGALMIRRHRGPGPVALLVVPVVAAFCGSALGVYPIAVRLMVFTSPFLMVLVAAGIVVLSSWLHRHVPTVRTAVLAAAFLIPSFEIAIRIRTLRLRDEEMRPIVETLRRREHSSSTYVFNRGLPAWAFYTTDWANPDTTRLRWIERNSGPGGLAHENGASRGTRRPGEGAELRGAHADHTELLGVSSGIRGRHFLGYSPERPDSNWAQNEAKRIRHEARPGIWIVLDNAAHNDEGTTLMSAVRAAGGQVFDSIVAPGVVAYWTRFAPGT
jgi:hypothetical protein